MNEVRFKIKGVPVYVNILRLWLRSTSRSSDNIVHCHAQLSRTKHFWIFNGEFEFLDVLYANFKPSSYLYHCRREKWSNIEHFFMHKMIFVETFLVEFPRIYILSDHHSDISISQRQTTFKYEWCKLPAWISDTRGIRLGFSAKYRHFKVTTR